MIHLTFGGIYMPPEYNTEDTPTTTTNDISEGQAGHLKISKLRFKVTKVEGDDITIRYSGSRQDWTGKKDDLLQSAELDTTA